MGRESPRFIPTQSLVEITARTVGGRFLLLPTAALTLRVLAVLGRALALFPVDLHAFAFMSNHWHGLISTPNALAASRFIQHVHANVTVAIRQLYGWEGKVFRKADETVVAPDAEEERLHYILAQGAKEGLVASPLDWPGAHCARALAGLEELQGVWIDTRRAREIQRGGSRAPGRKPLPGEITTVYPIELQPLPSWVSLDLRTRQDRVCAMIRSIEESAAALFSQPMGRERVLAKSPFEQPKERLEKRRAPRIHTGDAETRETFEMMRALFVSGHRAASTNLRLRRPSQLPAQCFPPTLPFQLDAAVVRTKAEQAPPGEAPEP